VYARHANHPNGIGSKRAWRVTQSFGWKDWKANSTAISKLDAAQVLIINGEGTLHHGKRKGLCLLEAGARVKANGGKVALINALWQDNPKNWGELTSQFDLLQCRDSRSAHGLSEQSGKEVLWFGDLSMMQPAEANGCPRQGITVSCSVNRAAANSLVNFAMRTNAVYVPVTSHIKHVNSHAKGLKRILRKTYAEIVQKRFLAKYSNTKLVCSDLAYMMELSQRELLVTGRFHAVCMAILTKTPFVAVTSNSWKIEALLGDIGLNPARVQPMGALTPDLLKKDWAFSDAESRAMEMALPEWSNSAEIMFDQIAALVPNPTK
jgi:hypothetical protein